jgi:hypothetical protein
LGILDGIGQGLGLLIVGLNLGRGLVHRAGIQRQRDGRDGQQVEGRSTMDGSCDVIDTI